MADRFELLESPMAGLHLLQRRKMGDARGYLSRLFCADELQAFGWQGPVAQINETLTSDTGTIRGLHYQKPPFSEMKLVTCIEGEVYDVVVDLRAGSETFGKTFGTVLSAENTRSLLIPQGFAHGFQTRTADVRMIYMHSAPFSAEYEGGLDALDKTLNIEWPLGEGMRSERDRQLPAFSADFEGVAL